MKTIIFLTVDDVITISWYQIKYFGGSYGIRDRNLLESATLAPQSTFSGNYLYEDLFAMSAAYAYGIIKNHPFVDGNKRTGIEAMLLFLACNGHKPRFTNQELYELGIAIATSKTSPEEIADLLRVRHSATRRRGK